MIFVTGGFAQGKMRFVEEHILPGIKDAVVIDHLHLRIREAILKGEDAGLIVDALTCSCGDAIVICDEIGSGIVPLDEKERLIRETTGRIACDIAAKAKEVYRVVCGIGVRIK